MIDSLDTSEAEARPLVKPTQPAPGEEGAPALTKEETALGAFLAAMHDSNLDGGKMREAMLNALGLTATQQATSGELPLGPADLRRAIDAVTGRNQLTGSVVSAQQEVPEYMHQITILTKEVKPTHWEPQGAEDRAYGYAKHLAEAIWFRHFKEASPDWKADDTLIGILTQIDNMAAGLLEASTQREQPAADDKAGGEVWAPTEAQYMEWCDRHGMQPTDREAFFDAASLYLSHTRPQPQAAQTQDTASLQRRVIELEEEISVDEKLLKHREQLLNAIPDCPVHGSGCVSHALEWIEEMQSNQRTEQLDITLRQKADAFIAAGHEFWLACRKEAGGGAVRWLRCDDGTLIIFTRGEYAEQLLRAIPTDYVAKELLFDDGDGDEVPNISAYAVNQAQPAAVPQGFVLVRHPVTEEMHIAAVNVLQRAHGLDGLPQRMLDAMLSASSSHGHAVREKRGHQ